MTALCPCCGGSMPSGPAPREELAGLAAGGAVSQSLVRRLARRPGHWVSTRELVEACYAHDPDGGPLSAAASIHITIMKLRPKLNCFGWTIEGSAGKRAHLGFRLVLA